MLRSIKSFNSNIEKFFKSSDDNKVSKKTLQSKNQNPVDPDFQYNDYYKFGEVLGRGRFGTVIECLRKSDNQPIAMKLFKCSGIHRWIPENQVYPESDRKANQNNHCNHSVSSSIGEHHYNFLPNEVACLIRAQRVNGVVRILDYLPANEHHSADNHSTDAHSNAPSSVESDYEKPDEDSVIGIVLERDPSEICLFDYLNQKQTLKESEAKFLIKQLVQINLDLLEVGILHGDLKSENILINPKSQKIKLIDFGSAQMFDATTKGAKINPKLVRTFRGTNLYKPPEYLLTKCFYPRPSTVWTIGVIMYDMVVGHFPFESDAEILEHKSKEIVFVDGALSQEFRMLVKRCLSFYVADRISIDKILLDPLFNGSE